MKLTACVSVAALVAAGALPAFAQQVGTVAAVNRDMTGTPPGASARDMQLGLDVVYNERVETSQVGSGQLMFLDQTTLTVSSNSDIVLDEYVYDPNAGTSDLALSMTRGALRFIGGRITKEGPATVRTPTATVGIRGGMAVLDVDGQGNTEVIHIAGEYTSVSQCGDANGDGLDDSCAPGEARSQVVLSRPNATARADRNGVRFTGLADSEKLAGIYGRFEGQGQGGVESAPSDPAVEGGSRQVATVNSGVAGGETNQPVSTSGEQAAPAAGAAEQVTEPTTLVQNTNPNVGGEPDNAHTPPPPPPPPADGLPEGGAAFAPAPEYGYQPFTTVLAGSIIGKNEVETIRFPVPTSAEGLLIEHPHGEVFTPLAVSSGSAGLFEFGPDSAFSDLLGPLGGEFGPTGIGLADLENEFVFAPFAYQLGEEIFDFGIAMFGTPTPGQGQFFPGDPNVTGAQTVDAYHNEAGLDLGESFLVAGTEGRSQFPEHLFLVGKSGQPRFASGSTGGVIAAESESAGPIGRAVSGTFQRTDGLERLALFVEPLTTSASTGPAEMTISGNGFITVNEGFAVGHAEPAYGTFEDAEGHTLFGSDGNYFVLSSVHRNRDGSLDTNDFGTGLTTLSTSEADVNSVFSEPAHFRASLFTRDESHSEVIANPLPLAGQPSFSADVNSLGGGFAAGLAFCSSLNCGDLGESEVPEFAGFYPLVSAAGPFGTTVSFDAHSAGMSFNFMMTDEGLSNIADADPENPHSFFLNSLANASFEETDQWGAYLDDRRFAAVGTGSQVIAGNVQQGTVGLGSSGLVGTPAGLFPAEVETDPEYLRWGYWAATYQVTDGTTGQARTDLVPVGTFVTGNVPDPGVLADFTGSAEYSGFAVGTVGDLTTGATRTVGGSFDMSYDFGSSAGQVDIALNAPDISPVSVPVFGESGNLSYGGLVDRFFDGGTVDAEIRGGFFAGGGSPAGATAGNFGIQDHGHGTVAIGVYGGDATHITGGGI